MIEFKNVSKTYSTGTEAVHNANFKIEKGDFCFLVGASGSGKSTLMYCLSTLKTPTDGKIIYNGKELTKLKNSERENIRRNEFGFVFQRHFLVPYMSAVDNVTVAAASKTPEVEEKAKKLLAGFGLTEKEFGKRPSKLSGGQRQRAAIARAMINDPNVLFADEPTAALDHENAFAVMKILKEYSKENLVLVITHDRSILSDADSIIEMWDGNISAIKGGEEE